MDACGPHGGGEDGSFLGSYDFCCGQYVYLLNGCLCCCQNSSICWITFFKKSIVYFLDVEQSTSLGRNKGAVFFSEFPELKWERECSLAGKNESGRWKQKTADTCCGGFQHSS